MLGPDLMTSPGPSLLQDGALLGPNESLLTAVQWTPDGEHIALGRADGTVEVFARATGRRVVSVRADGEIRGVAVTGDLRFAAALSGDGWTLWDLGRGVVFSAELPGAMALALHADGSGYVAGVDITRDRTTAIHFRPEDLEGDGGAQVHEFLGLCTKLWPDVPGPAALALVDGRVERWSPELAREWLWGWGGVAGYDPRSATGVRRDFAVGAMFLGGPGREQILLRLPPEAFSYPASYVWRGDVIFRCESQAASDSSTGAGDRALASDTRVFVKLTSIHVATGKVVRVRNIELDSPLQFMDVDPRGELLVVRDALSHVAFLTAKAGTPVRVLSPTRSGHITLAIGKRCVAALFRPGDGVTMYRFAESDPTSEAKGGIAVAPAASSSDLDVAVLHVCANGSTAAAVEWNGICHIWNTVTGERVDSRRVFARDVLMGEQRPSVHLSPKGKVLWVIEPPRAGKGERLARYLVGDIEDPVRVSVPAPSGRKGMSQHRLIGATSELAALVSDGHRGVHIFGVGGEPPRLVFPEDEILYAACARKLRVIAAVTPRGVLVAQEDGTIRVLMGSADDITALAVSPSGAYVAVKTSRGAVRGWHLGETAGGSAEGASSVELLSEEAPDDVADAPFVAADSGGVWVRVGPCLLRRLGERGAECLLLPRGEYLMRTDSAWTRSPEALTFGGVCLAGRTLDEPSLIRRWGAPR